MASYKDTIISVTPLLESVLIDMNDQEVGDELTMKLTKALEKLNPALHECKTDDCSIDTWRGVSDVCPVCENEGTLLGRLVK